MVKRLQRAYKENFTKTDAKRLASEISGAHFKKKGKPVKGVAKKVKKGGRGTRSWGVYLH